MSGTIKVSERVVMDELGDAIKVIVIKNERNGKAVIWLEEDKSAGMRMLYDADDLQKLIDALTAAQEEAW